MNFTTKTGVELTIRIDIEANSPNGFDEQTVRTVKENLRVLGHEGGRGV